MQWVFWICLCMVWIAKFSISQIYSCMQLVSLYTNMQVAVLAMEDMLAWMEEGGQVLSFFTLLIRTNECYHPCEVIPALTKRLAWLRDGCIICSSHQMVQCLLGWSYEKLKDKLLLAKDKWSRNWVLQVGVFDATNSTNARRNMLLKLAEGKCKACVLHFH